MLSSRIKACKRKQRRQFECCTRNGCDMIHLLLGLCGSFTPLWIIHASVDHLNAARGMDVA
eukprot:377469-Pelagomonas_calceolata.AAC.1